MKEIVISSLEDLKPTLVENATEDMILICDFKSPVYGLLFVNKIARILKATKIKVQLRISMLDITLEDIKTFAEFFNQIGQNIYIEELHITLHLDGEQHDKDGPGDLINLLTILKDQKLATKIVLYCNVNVYDSIYPKGYEPILNRLAEIDFDSNKGEPLLGFYFTEYLLPSLINLKLRMEWIDFEIYGEDNLTEELAGQLKSLIEHQPRLVFFNIVLHNEADLLPNDGMPILVAALKTRRDLTDLVFNMKNSQDADVEKIAELLANAPNIKTITLDHSDAKITIKSLEILDKVLDFNTSLIACQIKEIPGDKERGIRESIQRKCAQNRKLITWDALSAALPGMPAVLGDLIVDYVVEVKDEKGNDIIVKKRDIAAEYGEADRVHKEEQAKRMALIEAKDAVKVLKQEKEKILKLFEEKEEEAFCQEIQTCQRLDPLWHKQVLSKAIVRAIVKDPTVRKYWPTFFKVGQVSTQAKNDAMEIDQKQDAGRVKRELDCPADESSTQPHEPVAKKFKP